MHVQDAGDIFVSLTYVITCSQHDEKLYLSIAYITTDLCLELTGMNGWGGRGGVEWGY